MDSSEHKLGQSLGHSLASRHVAMISVGGIIGAGLFIGSSVTVSSVGPAILITYIMAGFLILCVMRMLGEMAVAHPGVGSFAEFARLGLGNWAGFTTGWLYWYYWVVVVAIEAVAGANMLREWLPFETWQIGLVLLATMTATNLVSARSYGEFEFWLSSLKVAAIIGFIAITLGWLIGFAPPDVRFLQNLHSHGGFMPHGVLSIFSGMTALIFMLCGAEIAIIAAAESAEPEKTIARMTVSVSLRIILFYFVSMALIMAVVPWNTVVPGTSPFVTALARIGVPGVSFAMKLIVLTATLSCLNSGIYVTSRVLFALAAKGDAPQALVALSRNKVPVRATLFGCLFGYGAVIASIISPQVVFAFLVNASGAIMLVVYFLIAWAQVRLRRKHPAPETMAIRMWLFPGLSYAVMAAILAVLVSMAFQTGLTTQFYASLVSVLAVLALYFLVRRRF